MEGLDGYKKMRENKIESLCITDEENKTKFADLSQGLLKKTYYDHMFRGTDYEQKRREE